ncbi:MAG: glycosyltransferase family 4 protein [Candidatus Glassbacteria bacterium]|nr:glycosyltransferase family 4 protein [Candidatus Glassbacteria bacterium]
MSNGILRENLHNVGFVSTRFAGTDGVSLETQKWSSVLEEMGLERYYLAGEIDTSEDNSMLVELASFKHPDIVDINQQCFGVSSRPRTLTQKIHRIKMQLKDALYDFIQKYDIQLLIAENSLTIPLNIPLGIALTEIISETGIKTIAHHHDFFWERKRFLVNAIWDYLNMAFPPHLNGMQHVVINSSGGNQLALRTGASSMLVPNVMDYETPPRPPDGYAENIRTELGIADDEIFILQPTRIVQRKGIEHAIKLTSRLGEKAKLVISHDSGDEGHDYEDRVLAYARSLDVDVILAADKINHERGSTTDGRKIYDLHDLYRYADLITFPSSFEGFGNAFLESLYYKKPLLVNNYSVYYFDIRTKGFRTIEIDDFITDETVAYTRKVLSDQNMREKMVEHNYDLAKRYFSYKILRVKLRAAIRNLFGEAAD